MMCAKLLRHHKKEMRLVLPQSEDRINMSRFYGRTLQFVLRFRSTTLLGL